MRDVDARTKLAMNARKYAENYLNENQYRKRILKDISAVINHARLERPEPDLLQRLCEHDIQQFHTTAECITVDRGFLAQL